MQKRKFDELISYFNRKVSEMEIGTSYKMELLGMVTALGLAHEKETEERKTGEWVYNTPVTMKCDQCGFVIADWDFIKFKFCPNCGAEMGVSE